MAVNSVLPPFPIFTDADGKPLEAGYIYIGDPGLEARSKPKASFFDSAMTVPTGTASGAAVRTMGGYAVYNGSPAMLYVDQDCSITVTDKNGVVVYTTLNRTTIFGTNAVVGPILAADGNLAAAGLSYASEPTTGHVRSGAGVEDDIVLGVAVSRRTVNGQEFLLPITIDAIRTVTDLNVLTNGEGVVAFTNAATGAEAGSYTATMRYRGNGSIAIQEAFIPGTGYRLRTYAASTWSAWAAQTTAMGIPAFGQTLIGSADAVAARATLGAQPAAQSGAGIGQLVALGIATGTALTLPAGGTWAWWYKSENTTSGVSTAVATGVSAGGTTIVTGSAGIAHLGFAWRIA